MELQLFAVAHLLVLREKVAPLGARLGPGVVAKKRPEKRAGVLGRLFGRRQASEQLDDARAIDAKKQLEDALRSACARVVALAHRALAGPYVDALRSMRDAPPPAWPRPTRRRRNCARARARPGPSPARSRAPRARRRGRRAGDGRGAAAHVPRVPRAGADAARAAAARAAEGARARDLYVAMCAALLPFDRVPSTEFEAFRAALADAEAAPDAEPSRRQQVRGLPREVAPECTRITRITRGAHQQVPDGTFSPSCTRAGRRRPDPCSARRS